MGCVNSTSKVQRSTPRDDSTDLPSIMLVDKYLIVDERKSDHHQNYGHQKFYLD